jgi:DNA-directed RNA polymerase subunit K/omega
LKNIFIEFQGEFWYFNCLYECHFVENIFSRRTCHLKDYGDIDSKFRYVILASMRAKQLLSGAKPRVKSRSKNLIRIAQEEVKKGLVDYEIVKGAKGDAEERAGSEEEMFIGEEIAEEAEEIAEESGEEEEPKKKK